ncbi:MAG: glycosyltransferase family 2 protein, partial [Deltaproteobacteria bacterium]|nr:glycosyltransferase family 2 protein [Deltaproteobacteria bacterium]
MTATFQRPSLVVEAVRSALSQEGPRVEVIVVDDDPAASAKAAVEAIGDARVSYVVREKTSGGVPALVYNDGLARAQGKTVLFLDDDDVLEPGAFKLLFEALEQKPEAAFAFGRTEPFGGAPDVMVHEMAFFLDASSRARNARSAGTRYLLAQLLFGSTLFVVSS